MLSWTGLVAQDDDPPPEEEEEPAKQLVFIEEHLASPGTLDGLESPYDLKVSSDGRHLYLASQRNDAVSYFTRDLSDGSLSYAGYFSEADIGTNALDGARSLAISPEGTFLYVASMFADSLVALQRDSTTGALSFLSATYDSDIGVDGLDQARSIVISPDGKNLYVAAYGDSKLSVFGRNATTGAVSFLGVYEEGDQGVEELTQPHALAISPDGDHLYVALWSNQLIVFERDSSTGLLTYLSKLAYLQAESIGSSGTPRAISISPDGKQVYVASWNTDTVSVFDRDATDGSLAHLSDYRNSDTDISNMDGPHALTISSDGTFVYVAAFASDAVVSFKRDLAAGTLEYYQSILPSDEESWTMNGPISIGASPDGEHVYVGSGSGTHSLVTFRREIVVDPPEFVVQPIARSIEEGESVAFHALAQGVDVGYQWYRDGTAISGQTNPVLTIAAVAASDDGALFRVDASNAGGSVSSDEVALTVLPPIVVDAPSDLTALDLSSSSARLVWADRSDNEISFEIQRRVIGESFATIATLLADRTEYVDATLEAATTYLYRLRAKRNDVVSLWSNDAVIESFDDAPRGPVNLDVLEQTYNKVLLSWADRSAVEDGFRIERRLDEFDAPWEWIGDAERNATQFEDRAVVAETTYAYRVQAYNESGSSDFSNSVVAITDSIPVETISPLSRSIPRDAVSGYGISVTSSRDWEALPSVSWLVVVSPVDGEGSGNEAVSYRALLNESQNERIGSIVVGGIEHTVVQAGSPPFLRIQPTITEKDRNGGIALVNIESNVDWTAEVTADWVSITSGQSGSDYGTVVLTFLPNETFEPRQATLMINDREHLVRQAAQEERLEISSDDTSFGFEGGVGSVAVESNIDWTASVSVSWIELTAPVSGSGDGTVAFSVLENDSIEPRTADILVNDAAITVSQEGRVEESIELEAPEFVSAAVDSGLGVELTWIDNSSLETGFVLRRAVSGSTAFEQVADLPADTQTYFDRDAPRGKILEYRLIAVSGEFSSPEDSIVTTVLPESNLINVATRVEMGEGDRLVFANLPSAGDGFIVFQAKSFGEGLGDYGLAMPAPAVVARVSSSLGSPSVEVTTDYVDWETVYGFAAPVGEGIRYSATHMSGSAYPRGAVARGHIHSSDTKIEVGFDFEGDIELPFLIKGVGPSLNRHSSPDPLNDPVVTLYALDSLGVRTLVATNSEGSSWVNETAITWEDALSKASSMALSSGDAGMLLMLAPGTYLAELVSESGSTGAAMLEVLDVR